MSEQENDAGQGLCVRCAERRFLRVPVRKTLCPKVQLVMELCNLLFSLRMLWASSTISTCHSIERKKSRSERMVSYEEITTFVRRVRLGSARTLARCVLVIVSPSADSHWNSYSRAMSRAFAAPA